MKRLAPESSRRMEAWFCDDSGAIISYSGEGYSLTWADREVERLVEKGVKSGRADFVMYKSDVAGHVNRMRLRAETYHRAAALFTSAFRQAVADRLRIHLKENSSYSEAWGITYRPGLALIKTGGRTYPIYVTTRGEIQWLEGSEADFMELT